MIRTLSRIRRYPESQIGPDTDLVADLGIAGDDAEPVLLEILKIYPIDFSGVNLHRHFGSEGIAPWQIPGMLCKIIAYPIQRWLLNMSSKEIIGQHVLVSDVVDSVMAGKWTLEGSGK